jgi:hypothetical protein
MQPSEELIPRPPIVRERLAQSLRETRRLKRLLRLSVEAAEERHPQLDPIPAAYQTAARPEGVGR